MNKKEMPLKAQRIEFPSDDFRIMCERRRFCENDRAFHEELEIKLYYKGSSAVMIGKDVFVATEGDITVVNPFEIHSNLDIKDYEGEYILLMLSLDFLKELVPRGLDLRQSFITKGRRIKRYIKDDKRLSAIISRICEELEEKRESFRIVVYSLVTELFALLFRDYTDTECSKGIIPEAGRTAELISPALTAIFENYSRPLSIDALAELCNISKYHFCRVFKEEMKMTAVQYITSYRISLADVMLKGSDKSVDEIAAECGFSDLSYFYRCYKRYKGSSPKRAREK